MRRSRLDLPYGPPVEIQMTSMDVDDDSLECSQAFVAPPPTAVISTTHPQNVIDGLRRLHRNCYFYDAHLIAGDQHILAHRVVLNAATDVFHGKLDLDSEGKPRPVCLPMFGSNPVHLFNCIEFIYSGEAQFPTTLNLEIIAIIIQTARALRLHEYNRLFMDYLGKSATVENLTILNKVTKYRNQDGALKKSLESFVENLSTSDIDVLTGGTLQALIVTLSILEDLNGEHKKWQSLIHWVRRRLHQRMYFVVDLIKLVDYKNMSRNFVENVILKERLLKYFPECRNYIKQFRESSDEIETSTERLFGIVTLDPHTCVILHFDTILSKFYKLDRVPLFPSSYLDVTVHKGNVFVGNGRELWQLSNFPQNWWKKVYSEQKRQTWQAPCYNRCIGCGPYVAMVCCYRTVAYRLTCPNRGIAIYSNVGAHSRGFCVASSRNIVYVIGGEYTATLATEIDVENMRYWYLPDIANPRVDASAVFYEKCVYVFGGVSVVLDRFNTVTRQWCSIQNFNMPCSRFTAFFLSGKVYFVGRGKAPEIFSLGIDDLKLPSALLDKYRGNTTIGWRDHPQYSQRC